MKEATKLVGIGVTVGVVLWLLKGTVVAGAKVVGEAVRPTNSNNIFARGVDAVGDILDDGQDDGSFSLGGFIFDIFNGSAEDRAVIEGLDENKRRIEDAAAENLSGFFFGRESIDG